MSSRSQSASSRKSPKVLRQRFGASVKALKHCWLREAGALEWKICCLFSIFSIQHWLRAIPLHAAGERSNLYRQGLHRNAFSSGFATIATYRHLLALKLPDAFTRAIGIYNYDCYGNAARVQFKAILCSSDWCTANMNGLTLCDHDLQHWVSHTTCVACTHIVIVLYVEGKVMLARHPCF